MWSRVAKQSRKRNRGRSRWFLSLAAAALACAIVAAVAPLRVSILLAVGSALVLEDVATAADIIVLSPITAGAGPLEAADLVQRKIATRVAIFTDPPSGDDHEFIRRGLPYEDAAARQMRQLRSLGFEDIEQIPRTASLSELLIEWCGRNRIRSVVFVSHRAESRRVQRMLDRAMRSSSTTVNVQPARFSGFEPDRWWETTGGIRTAVIEFQKLIADYILHPPLPWSGSQRDTHRQAP